MRSITRHRYVSHNYLRINYSSNEWARSFVAEHAAVLPRTDHVLVYEAIDFIRDAHGNLQRDPDTREFLVQPRAGSTYEQVLQRLGMDRRQLNAAIAAVQGPPEYHSRRPMSNHSRDRLAHRAQERRMSDQRIREMVNSGVAPDASNHSQVPSPQYRRPAARAAHLAFLAGGQ